MLFFSSFLFANAASSPQKLCYYSTRPSSPSLDSFDDPCKSYHSGSQHRYSNPSSCPLLVCVTPCQQNYR
ncbi:hypothetical protein Hanom_Chr10g00944851 [Helianthus anomalus]